jgi:hypothetical protein
VKQLNGKGERFITYDAYSDSMPYIDSTGVQCGKTDCRFHEGLITLGCTNLSMLKRPFEKYFQRGSVASIKICPCYEKGDNGYTSQW